MPLPTDYHADLEEGRLKKVAALIVQGRNDALDRLDPVVGCNNWTVGCEAYGFGCYRISEAVALQRFPWLDIVDPTAQFIFTIGSIPVRFYRGAPDEPNSRTLRQSFSELRQLSLGFEEVIDSSEFAFRIAIETDFDGVVSGAFFVVLSGDQVVFTWEIPLDAPMEARATVPFPPAEGVELPKPSVGTPGQRRPAAANDD